MSRKAHLKPEEIERIKSLRNEGLGLDIISERTGISMGCISRHTKNRRINERTGCLEHRCSNCFQFKDGDSFYRKGKGADGRILLQSVCKVCKPSVCMSYRNGAERGERHPNEPMPIRASLNRVMGNPERVEPIYAEA